MIWLPELLSKPHGPGDTKPKLASPATSAYVVLSLGALGGGVVKASGAAGREGGLTGFGSAIINLLVWVVATSIGVDGGTLTQAVVAECMSCVVCAVPLLVMTSAHRTASWRLILTTTTFAAAGAPLGALLLSRLNARVVELVMGCVLLLVLALQARLHERAGRALRDWRHGSPLGLLGRVVAIEAQMLALKPGVSVDRLAAVAAPPSTNAGRDIEAAAQGGQADDEAAPLLDGLAAAHRGAAAGTAAAFVSVHPTRGGSCGLGSADASRSTARARVQSWLARQDWPEFRRALLYGSGAGFTSGVMSGLTGMSGPPIILMYEKLKIAKDVVRGTNAVGNVLQVRLIAYIVMGVFRRVDFLLYGLASAVGLAGVGVGHRLAGRLDQDAFSKVLAALMVVCCTLLFMSAAGLKGNAS
ncbi:hypothetical protein TSOC_000796 [Tetrabaena socialis]|uniref:Uncharacterized protein n=1 Tax=Tetrabaena socialis TaxID=47790 RepID=A0A2J8AIG8_9CHLO|nr:hypothetical protein TSOC_000796 [Tetrabaena socialis]|eukprot:PNH12309.1 hypothetical protein TSOC_000796 [Tetrabaena socialis]